MVKQREKKFNNIYFIICFFLFIIAGLLQYFDEYANSYWINVFTVLEHTIFLSLGIIWAVSIWDRVVDKKLRLKLIFVAMLLMLLIYLRFIKYNLFFNNETIKRYLWYSYYIPQCFVPVTMFSAILGIEKKKGKPQSKLWNLLFIPSIALIILIMTNDYHQTVFKFADNLQDYESNYTHGIIYYFTFTWIIGITLLSLGVLFYRCKISAVRKKLWLPLLLFITVIILTIMCFSFNTKAFKVPEMVGLTFVVLFESCLQIGIIPTNRNYEKYFDSSSIGAMISNNNYEIKYKSKNSFEIDEKSLKEISENKVMILNNIRLQAKQIDGGNVYWEEDISGIISLTDKLSEIKSDLSSDNELIEKENELREKQAHILEQTILYDEIINKVNPSLFKIEQLLKGLKDTSLEYEKHIHLACIYGVYIKRICNLTIIGKDCPITKIAELSFAINETMKYLSLSGVSCSYICDNNDQTITHKATEIIYEFIEACIEKGIPNLKAIIVNLFIKKDSMYCRVTLGEASEAFDEQQYLETHPIANGKINVVHQSDNSDYITLILSEVCL